MKKFGIVCFILLFGLLGCVQLHHVQIGEITSHPNYVQKPFDIKISETGISLREAGDIADAVSRHRGGSDNQLGGQISAAIGLFQMGPHTGNPVYSKNYARNLIQVIYEKCPSGRVTGLMSVRETRKYPVVSGEIVHITGYCLLKKG